MEYEGKKGVYVGHLKKDKKVGFGRMVNLKRFLKIKQW